MLGTENCIIYFKIKLKSYFEYVRISIKASVNIHPTYQIMFIIQTEWQNVGNVQEPINTVPQFLIS